MAQFPTRHAIALTVAIVTTVIVDPAAAAGKRNKPAHSWTGAYVGGNLGYGWGDGEAIDPNAVGSTTPLFSAEAPFIVASQLATLGPLNTSPKGIQGGVQAGYNYQAGGVVFGVEVDYAWADIVGSSSRTLHSEFNIPGEPGFGVTTNMAVRDKLESLATLRARLGFAPAEQGLLYVTGGLALGQASYGVDAAQFETSSQNTACVGFTPLASSGSGILAGWTAGAGGEWALTPKMSAKAEYLHYDLGSTQNSANQIKDISCPTSNPASTPFAFVDVHSSAEFRGDLVRIGLNFKLDGP